MFFLFFVLKRGGDCISEYHIQRGLYREAATFAKRQRFICFSSKPTAKEGNLGWCPQWIQPCPLSNCPSLHSCIAYCCTAGIWNLGKASYPYLRYLLDLTNSFLLKVAIGQACKTEAESLLYRLSLLSKKHQRSFHDLNQKNNEPLWRQLNISLATAGYFIKFQKGTNQSFYEHSIWKVLYLLREVFHTSFLLRHNSNLHAPNYRKCPTWYGFVEQFLMRVLEWGMWMTHTEQF